MIKCLIFLFLLSVIFSWIDAVVFKGKHHLKMIMLFSWICFVLVYWVL